MSWWQVAGVPEPDDGDDPLAALAGIGNQRRMLDEAELRMVRAARRAGKSWAEIATKLGISRQSAWEKWRDLDEDADPADRLVGSVAAELSGLRSNGTVPDVVGMSYDDARDIVMRARLVPVNPTPDSPPLVPSEWHAAVVVRQYPDPGAKLHPGSEVKLWVERGGGSAGVREPRRPRPPLREGTAEVDLDPVVGD